MSDFTYIKPNEKKYYQAIVQVLESKNKPLAEKLKLGYCVISDTSSYSQIRWDGMYTIIYIYIPIEFIDQINEDEKGIILKVCDKLMPKEIGFDVREIEIGPILDSIAANKSLEDDLLQITNNQSYTIVQSLPQDIKEKGQQMAEVYSYLYCIENTLRIFIEKLCTNTFGNNDINNLSIPSTVRKKIEQRKEEENKNQWICIRGDSDLYYLDFKELGDIIVNNWLVFKDFFPEQAFVTSKINELARCRNLIAHNSLITQSEKDLLRLYYNQFLSQINGTRHE